MSSFLYSWGKTAYQNAGKVAGVWLLVILVLIGVIASNPPTLNNEIRIDGTSAQEVIDDLAVAMPEASGGQGLIAFHVQGEGRIDDGENLAALLDAIDGIYGTENVIDTRQIMAEELERGSESHLLQSAGAVAEVQATIPASGEPQPQPLVVEGNAVPGVIVSADGSTALFQFMFTGQTFELEEGVIQETIDIAEAATGDMGIQVLPSSSMTQIPELIGIGEVIGVGIAAIVLIITLGSVVAAGLPLVSALAGVGVGVGGAFALSSLFQMHSLTAVLALMLGIAVGIDYALFIVNRQRRLILDEGISALEATGRALGTSGSAVIFAGTTVVIALLALIVVEIDLLTTMSLTAAATVTLAVVSAITLLPALLGFAGERICSDRARETAKDNNERGEEHRFAKRWSTFLTRSSSAAALGALAVAVLLSVPVIDMQLGLPSGASYNPDTSQRQSFDLISERFGPGYNGPLIFSVSSESDQAIPAATIAAVYQRIVGEDGIESAALGGVSQDGQTAIFSIVTTSAPTSQDTEDLVKRFRDLSHSIESELGVEIGITGISAMGVDVSNRLSEVLPIYIAVVVGLSLIILTVVFRSIIVPIKATIGFLLSVGATFGATTAVFQWGWLQAIFGLDATSPVLSILPIVLVGVLYGLAMDYEVFLVSSMKEAHAHGYHGAASVVRGFSVASKVVVAAALIMISVFVGFIFNPEPMIAQFGFALAFGVAIDAFLVRMTFVPAVMAWLGNRAWYLPSWLEKILPNLDIEGDKLNEQLREAKLKD